MRTSNLVAFPAALIGLLWTHAAFAGPFRSASIHWRLPDPVTAPLTAEVTVDQAWQASSPGCQEVTFGDGSTSQACASAALIGAGVDPSGSPFVVKRLVATHTFPSVADYVLALDGCCRPDGIVNGAGAAFHLESRVAFSAGNEAGPLTAAFPVIGLQAGGVRHYDLPIFDSDGDPVTCRFAGDGGAGFASSVPALPEDGSVPSVYAVKDACRIEWDLTHAAPGDRFTLGVVVESTHGGLTSSSAVDLLAQIVADAPPECFGGGPFIAPIGKTFGTLFGGADPANGALFLSGIGADPSQFSTTFGQLVSSPWSSSFSWTPTIADRGTTRIVLASFTNEYQETGTCSLALQVPDCMGFGDACTVGTGQCQASGTIECQADEAVCSGVEGTPSPEVCGDEVDNDCDGVVDNGCQDSDGDGLADWVEAAIGTDPFDADSDDDGVLDGLEPHYAADSDGDGVIDALDPDADEDGLFDGTELGLDCSNPATDLSKGHCVADGDKGLTKTDPTLADSDGGGMLDGREDLNLNGAVDPGERDPLNPLDDGGCKVDSDCGGPHSGKVCDDKAECIDGCRATGNGCVPGKTCTSTSELVGDCIVSQGSGGSGGGTAGQGGSSSQGTGGTLVGGEGGSDPVSVEPSPAPTQKTSGSCAVAWTGGEAGGLWAVVAMSVAVTARRRRRH